MTARRVAMVFPTASALLCAVELGLLRLSIDASIGEGGWGFRGFGLFNAIASTVLAAIVVTRRPANLIGRVLRATGECSAQLCDEVDLEAVRADALDAVRDTVPSAHASMWLR